jgi:hypothetical protein
MTSVCRYMSRSGIFVERRRGDYGQFVDNDVGVPGRNTPNCFSALVFTCLPGEKTHAPALLGIPFQYFSFPVTLN